MPRVTRAAARADPVLADETESTVEAAITEDAATVPLPESPTKTSERRPLGEVGANKAAPIVIEEQELDTSPQEEAEIILHLDENIENNVIKSVKKNPGKPNGTASGKKSTKKAKGTLSRRANLEEQFSETVKDWTQTIKGQTSPIKSEAEQTSASSATGSQPTTPNDTPRKGKSKRKKASKKATKGNVSTNNGPEIVILEDEDVAPGSPASDKAAEMLKDDESTGPVLILDDAPAKPSPAASVVGDQVVSPVSENQASSNKPEAIQRLESLFKQADEQLIQPSTSPLADAIAHTTAHAVGMKADPIEEMDRLQEDIEATEASLNHISKPKSALTTGKAATAQVNKAKTGKATTSSHTKPVVRQNVAKTSVTAPVKFPAARKAEKPSTSSTPTKKAAVETQKRMSTIAALQTPPKIVKSTKPVTKSTFSLPGDAAAARLKAMREERERRREEKEKEAKDQKATGTAQTRTLKRTSVLPSQTSTARASRPSVAVARPVGNVTSRSHVSPVTVKSTSSRAPTKPAANMPRVALLGTSVSGGKPPTAPTGNSPTVSRVIASQTVRPIPTTTIRPLPSTTNTATTARARVSMLYPKSASDENTTKSTVNSGKGREVYNREKLAKEAKEKAAKERTEALKKAKEEATMRGKAAARAWAEKKKAKAVGPVPSSAAAGHTQSENKEQTEEEASSQSESSAISKAPTPVQIMV